MRTVKSARLFERAVSLNADITSLVKTVLLKQQLLRRRSGQGITEYAAILAFVALLVALVFAFAPTTLSGAISSAFSAVISQVNNMSAASGAAS